MKKLYSLIVACLLTGGAFAQTSTSGTTKSGIKYGIKAGVNFATMTETSDDDDDEDDDDGKGSVTSFHIGGTVDIPLGTSFFIQPGLTLNGKGRKFEATGEGAEGKYTENIMYLEIPVNALYKIQNFYIGAGPYAAFAVSGKAKADGDFTEDGETKEEDLKFGSNEDEDDYKSTDFGLNVLAGYQLSNGLTFGINYGLGLNNIVNDDDLKVKNRVFSISVGFKF